MPAEIEELIPVLINSGDQFFQTAIFETPWLSNPQAPPSSRQ